MSLASIGRPAVCLAALSLAVALAACSPGPGANQSWSGPGWYLEKPYLVVLGGPKVFGGPYTYDQCEEERIKLPVETRSSMQCMRENRRPERYGSY
jgi:hypothetical protein